MCQITASSKDIGLLIVFTALTLIAKCHGSKVISSLQPRQTRSNSWDGDIASLHDSHQSRGKLNAESIVFGQKWK